MNKSAFSSIKRRRTLKPRFFQPKIICNSPSPTRNRENNDNNRELPDLSLNSDKISEVSSGELYNKNFITLVQPIKPDWFVFRLSIGDMEREMKIDSFFLRCSIRRFMEIITETYIDKSKVVYSVNADKKSTEADILQVVANLSYFLNETKLELSDIICEDVFKSVGECNIKIMLNK